MITGAKSILSGISKRISSFSKSVSSYSGLSRSATPGLHGVAQVRPGRFPCETPQASFTQVSSKTNKSAKLLTLNAKPKLLTLFAPVIAIVIIATGVFGLTQLQFNNNAHAAMPPFTGSFAGAGTQTNPYQITNATELQYFIDATNDATATPPAGSTAYDSAYYIMTNDIDASSLGTLPYGAAVLTTRPFKGNFDGQNHTITNLVINTGADTSFTAMGFIGILNGTTAVTQVANLTIGAGSSITNTNTAASAANVGTGGFIGYMVVGTIANLSNSAQVTSAGANTGGIVGYINNASAKITPNTTLSNSGVINGAGNNVGGIIGYVQAISAGTVFAGDPSTTAIGISNSGAVTGKLSYVGGFFGQIGTANVTVGSVTNSVTVTGNGYTGGVVGQMTNGTIGVSGGTITNEGAINNNGGTAINFGGIVGLVNGAGVVITANSTLKNTAPINGYGYVGGVIGYLQNVSAVTFAAAASLSATGVSNTGTVTGTSAYTGGFFGAIASANVTINSLTNNVTVKGTTGVGGIVGYMPGGTIANATNIGTVTGTSTNIGGIVGNSSGGSIANANNAGIISGTGSVGGIVGTMTGGTLGLGGGTITNSGTFSGLTGNYLGGIVGYVNGVSVVMAPNSTLKNTADVSGYTYSGGIIGGISNISTGTVFSDTASLVAAGISNTGTVTGASSYTGGLFGLIGSANVTIDDVTNTITVKGTTGVGGVVGYLTNGKIINATNKGSVTGTSSAVGGIVGTMSSGTVASATNTETVTGGGSTGGVVGSMTGGTLGANGEILSNGGAITGTGNYTGGIVGIVNGAAAVITPNSALSNTGAVSGNAYNGGIIGYLQNVSSANFADTASATATGISNAGTVTGTSTYTGGFFGYINTANVTIGSVTNTVAVIGNGSIGGIVGYMTAGTFGVNGGVITNSGKISGSGSNYYGGIIGYIGSATIAPNCMLKNTAEINGYSGVGGIIGNIATLSTGVVFADTASATTTGISNTGTVTATATTVTSGAATGGFFGSIAGTNITIGSVTNTVVVTGNGTVGGIVGNMTNGTLGVSGGIITNTGAVNAITGATGSNFGGIVGLINGANVTITPNITLKNTAPISGYSNSGGIVGYLQNVAAVTFNNTASLNAVGISNTGDVIATGNDVGGFFGYITSTNVTVGSLTNTVSVAGGGSVGGIIGAMTGGTLGVDGGINSNSGAISATSRGSALYFGGIIGYASGDIVITPNSTLQNTADINGIGGVGGIMGTLSSASIPVMITFDNTASATAVGVSNTGSVTGTSSRVGGLFGSQQDAYATITNITNTVDVTGGTSVGGIVGNLDAGTISNSYNIGAVTALSGAVGGIVGQTLAGTVVSDSYNLGSVSGSITGGIVGLSNGGTISSSYNAGLVSGLTEAGGFVGRYVDGTFINCYFDTTTSQLSSAAGDGAPSGITAVPTLDLASSDTLPAGFNPSVWGIGLADKITYPYLLWQITTGASNAIGFTSIQPPADTPAATANPTIVVVLPASGAAVRVFNPFGANFAPLTARAINNIATIAAQGTPVSVGVMSASNVVAFDDRVIVEQSADPTIDSITAGDKVVTGTGVPGASITVTFPGGSTASATVGSDGHWPVNSPIVLSAGDIVTAVQTEPGKSPSSTVSATVKKAGLPEVPGTGLFGLSREGATAALGIVALVSAFGVIFLSRKLLKRA